MRPGVFWGVLGYPGVSWGNQTDPKKSAQKIPVYTEVPFCAIFSAALKPAFLQHEPLQMISHVRYFTNRCADAQVFRC